MVTTCSLPLDGGGVGCGGVTGCFHPLLNPLLPPPASGGGIRKGIISALPSREGRFWFDTLQLAAGFFIDFEGVLCFYIMTLRQVSLSGTP